MGEPMCLMLGVLEVVALLALILGITWAGSKATDIMVGQKHRILEEVLRTSDVPASWRRPHMMRVSRARGVGRVREARNRAKADYLRRLDGLLSYVQKTTLVADEETRAALLEQLASVQVSWEGQDADEF